MNRIVMILALTSGMTFAQSPYSRDRYANTGHVNEAKTGITISAGFEIGSSNAEIDNSQLNSIPTQINPQNQNQDYDFKMRGFNIQGSYDSGFRFGDGLSTSTNFGVSHLSSSNDNDDNNNNNNNSFSVSSVQNFNQPQLEAKKTTVYIEQTLNFNAEFEGVVFQPFIGLNLGVGKFSVDSNQANNGFSSISTVNGFQNLETNFFQAGLAVGANLIISDTFVPFIKGRFTKEFHSVSTYNDGSNFSGSTFGSQNNQNQDPDLDSTTISGIIGVGFAF